MALRTTTIPGLRVTFEPDALRRADEDLKGVTNGLPRAQAGAINKVLPRIRTVVTNELGGVLTAKRNNILGRVRIGHKATPQKLSGSIHIQLRQIALINFKHKEKRRKRGWGTRASGSGVTVQIYKNGAAQTFPHAFIATGRRDQSGGGGNRHIFQRVSNAAGRRVARFPVVSLKGVSLMKEYQKRPDMQARVNDRIGLETTKQLESQTDRLLKRPRRGLSTTFL